jgi:hypothetical protein
MTPAPGSGPFAVSGSDGAREDCRGNCRRASANATLIFLVISYNASAHSFVSSPGGAGQVVHSCPQSDLAQSPALWADVGNLRRRGNCILIFLFSPPFFLPHSTLFSRFLLTCFRPLLSLFETNPHRDTFSLDTALLPKMCQKLDLCYQDSLHLAVCGRYEGRILPMLDLLLLVISFRSNVYVASPRTAL